MTGVEIKRTQEDVQEVFDAMRTQFYIMEAYEDNEQALLQELMTCSDEIFDRYRREAI